MRWLKNILTLAIFISVAHVAWAAYSIYAFGTAVQRGDAVAIEPSVDWPRLRDGLKSTIAVEMAKTTENDDAVAGSIGASIGMLFVDNLVDSFVSPASLSDALSGTKNDAQSPFKVQRAYFNGGPDVINIELEGGITASFEMQGVRWKLVSIWGLEGAGLGIQQTKKPQAIATEYLERAKQSVAQSQTNKMLEKQAEDYIAKHRDKLDELVADPTVNRPKSSNHIYIRVGAYSTLSEAETSWAKLATAFPALLSGIEHFTTPVNSENQTLYGLDIGPWGSESKANEACASLRQSRQACTVITQ